VTTKEKTYEITLPEGRSADQDQEWCTLHTESGSRRLRFHDYDEIYSLPGLYEQLFYDLLRCDSPRKVIGRLEQSLREAGTDPSSLRVLDIGAGNGMVGEQLAEMGAGALMGIDIIPEAKQAAERDRPGLYDGYEIVDLTDMPRGTSRKLKTWQPNALTCVAALGFGDIPPEAFATAYDMLPIDSWLAFCIKEDFLEDDEEPSGFSTLIDGLCERNMIEVAGRERYLHRLAMNGKPIHYIAIAARKRDPGSAHTLL
jgi:hypothetical protein